MSSTIPQIPPDVATSDAPDFKGLTNALMNQVIANAPAALEAAKEPASSFVAEIAAALVELSIEITSEVGKRIGQAVDEFEGIAGPEIERAAAAAISDFFNTSVSPSQISRTRSPGARFAFSQNLGAFVLEQMFGAFEIPQTITPETGRSNAERILGFNIGTVLESWLGKVVSTTPLTKWIPNWADLDTVLQQSLGLGRVNRRILGPLLKTLVADPFQWDINRRFGAEIFNASQLIRLRQRKVLDDGKYFEGMSFLGFDVTKARQIFTMSERLPEKEDIAKMLEVGEISEDRARGIYEALGFSDTGAEAMLRITRDDRLRVINNAIDSTSRDMFRDREIDQAEYTSLLRTAGRSEEEIQSLVGLALIERARPRSLPRGTIEEGFRKNMIPLSRLREYYEAEGFSLDDRILLEELAVEDRLELEERERRNDEKAKGTEFRTLPRAQMEKAFIQGIVGRGRLAEYYDTRGFSAGDQAVLLELATKRKTEHDRKLEEELAAAAEPDFKDLPRGTMEQAFIRGVISESRLRSWFVENNFAPETIPIAIDLARQKKDELAERLEDDLRKANRADFTDLPRSVMEEAFIRDIVTETRLVNWYEAKAFRASEIPILLELVRERKQERQAKAAETPTKPTA